jgi:hypothetical protein
MQTSGRAFAAALIAAGVVLAGMAPIQHARAADKPNIVFILADNVGYGVLSRYNGGILDTPTARIDKLAAEGLTLTNFNVENQCTPSRAALMTGRLPIRSGIGKAIAAGAFNLAADPKERFNIIWQNTWLGERIAPFVAAYQASVKKYPNLAGGQPNDQPPRYGREDAAAETGAEGVNRKLQSLKEH